MTPLLEVRDVQKSFGKHQALRDIRFCVQPGEIISVLGPSGCGKSTLLQIIAGLQQPDAGEVLMRGERVATATSLVPPEKRKINMVFQDYALWPHMSVFDNIAYGLQRKKAAAGAIRAKVGELVSLLRLEGLEQRLPPQLSGGQQQRVAIARALATEPDLLLLDEPLSNLDMRLRITMRTEMAYLFRRLGTTVFHVTHDPDEAFAMADRLIIMRAGAVDQIADTATCYSHPATQSAASLLGAGNQLSGTFVFCDHQPAVRIGQTVLLGMIPGAYALRPETAVHLLCRPDDLLWQEEPWTVQAWARRTDGRIGDGILNQLACQVVHSTFEGSRWRILGQTPDGQQVTYFYSQRIDRGTQGWLLLPQPSAFLYPPSDER